MMGKKSNQLKIKPTIKLNMLYKNGTHLNSSSSVFKKICNLKIIAQFLKIYETRRNKLIGNPS